MLKIRASLNNIRPYKPGKPTEELIREYNISGEIVKLASNENPIGASPKAVSAISQVLNQIHLYPDNSCHDLVEKLSATNNIPTNQVIVGNGSVELILHTALTYLEPEAEVIMSDISFVMYRIAAHIAGARPVVVPVKNYKHDLQAMLEAITDKTRLIFVDNPNNPLGSLIHSREMDNFIAQVPNNILIVMDEAYYEYVDSMDYPNSLQYIHEDNNIITLRTFSKIYGLASLRVGYGFSTPEIIQNLRRVSLPFAVNRIAQVAAIEALDDKNHRDESKAVNEKGKVFLTKELEKIGLDYVPPYGNFIFVLFPQETAPIHQALERKGVIVRPVGMKNALRVSIGTQAQNQRFITALTEIMNNPSVKQ